MSNRIYPYEKWRTHPNVTKAYPAIPAVILAGFLKEGSNPAEEREEVLRAEYEKYKDGKSRIEV